MKRLFINTKEEAISWFNKMKPGTLYCYSGANRGIKFLNVVINNNKTHNNMINIECIGEFWNERKEGRNITPYTMHLHPTHLNECYLYFFIE